MTPFLRFSFCVGLLAFAGAALAQPPPQWFPLSTGASAFPFVSDSDVDAAGNVYVIEQAGVFAPPELRRWDGTQWTTLPGSIGGGSRLAVTDAGDAAYFVFGSTDTVTDANGNPTTVCGVARYDV
ncbi:MAG: hypothetical protein R3362_09265, partial [Rhodothermales bacterium]|nr:hypothetical protein [Rhodothermales bacterium]